MKFSFNAPQLNHHDEFRFHADDIIHIASALLPPVVQSASRHSAPRTVALCVVLRVLAYPERLERTAAFFGRKSTWLSSVFHATLDILHRIAVRAFRQFSPDLQQRIPDMAQAIYNRFGFRSYALLDGTKWFIPRPSIGQRVFYNGYERGHVE